MQCIIKTGSKDNLLKIEIEGHATWENASYFLDFVIRLIADGKTNILIDLAKCVFMDSTYFGVLAELAEIASSREGVSVHLANVPSRIFDEMKTMGLDRLLDIADENILKNFHGITASQNTFEENYSKLQKAKQILKAHQTLEKLTNHNKEEFKDVIKYFREFIEREESHG